ncbi:MAG: hypothetical protein K1X36_10865 [Pyrinomonadaceae bacterium]|nr:hypothetical protein [Pyrinomonadaceae bacterium]
MANCRELVTIGKFAEAEAAMLAATDRGEGYFPDCEVRASFYENWGDTLSGEDQIAKYREALNYWQMHASQATSGGEGTARMLDVYRVSKKIDG